MMNIYCLVYESEFSKGQNDKDHNTGSHSTFRVG